MYQNLTLDTIRFRMMKTAEWRRGIVTSYRDDPRNLKAAKQLDKLVGADHNVVAPEIWSALEPFATLPCLREAINTASREVGFRSHPATFSDFLSSIVSKLPATN
jgi:hypothetical protein